LSGVLMSAVPFVQNGRNDETGGERKGGCLSD
jgi:hypothetical protein